MNMTNYISVDIMGDNEIRDNEMKITSFGAETVMIYTNMLSMEDR
jgi:hypothetical protein